MKKETICDLSKSEAISQKNSFMRDLYHRLFNWIVINLNKKINEKEFNDKKVIGIGILDIFGFEIFDKNLFEQFCINWANEKLQQQFNEYTFNSQLKLLKYDGINIDRMKFKNNDKCIQLIENKHIGIISLIVDECKMPKGSDQGLIKKIEKKYKNHLYFKQIKRKNKKLKKSMFIIKHFVDSVTYSFDGCLATNKDKTPLIYVDIIKKSKIKFIKNLYIDLNENKQTQKNNKSKTVAEQFKKQLSDLMKTMNATHPHYIRCLKPNIHKKPGLFDAKIILNQLKASGVFEIIRVRNQLYSYNLSQEKFLKKYKFILRKECQTQDFKNLTTTEKIDIFLQKLNEIKNGIIGKHILKGEKKIFWNDTARIIMNEEIDKGVLNSIIIIQSLCKCIYITNNYIKMKLVMNGLKISYLNENINDMIYWKQITEKLRFQDILNYYYDKIEIYLNLYQLNKERKDDQLLKVLENMVVTDFKFAKKLKYEIPIKQILKKIRMDNDNDFLDELKKIIVITEKNYPELDLLKDARVKLFIYIFFDLFAKKTKKKKIVGYNDKYGKD